MGAEDHLCLMVNQIFDGLHSLVDALGIGDIALCIKGDVKVAADEDSLARYVDVFDSFFIEVIHNVCAPLFEFSESPTLVFQYTINGNYFQERRPDFCGVYSRFPAPFVNPTRGGAAAPRTGDLDNSTAAILHRRLSLQNSKGLDCARPGCSA